MTSLTDRTIAALRAEHNLLAAHAAALTDDHLTFTSGARDWTVAQALSHLGSGAEIGLATLRAALSDQAAPDDDFNQSVWDRWNALSPREQQASAVEHDNTLVTAHEALDRDQRQTLRVPMGFLPEPLPLESYAGMRLIEAGLHGWDVRVATDPVAGLPGESAQLLAGHFAGDLGFLLGFIGKADQLAGPAAVEIAGTPFTFTVDDSVALTTASVEPTATFSGPLDAVIRLITGRLAPPHTPADIAVDGSVSLDDLRRVFPGY